MSNFRFRLTSLLRLRESTRDERRARLAEALAAEAKLLARRDQLALEIHASEQTQRASLGLVDIDRLMATHRYELVLKAEAHAIREQHALVEAEIEKRREALLAADRDVRILEKLREKQAERHAQSQAALQAGQMDELAARHWRRGDE
jgi:flagellar FliJ protein